MCHILHDSYVECYLITNETILSVLQLLKIFEVQKKEGRMYEFDPTRAIFVCNKWDQVPPNEDEKVWNNTAAKLKDNWPNFSNKQMFKLSTKEVVNFNLQTGTQGSS